MDNGSVIYTTNLNNRLMPFLYNKCKFYLYHNMSNCYYDRTYDDKYRSVYKENYIEKRKPRYVQYSKDKKEWENPYYALDTVKNAYEFLDYRNLYCKCKYMINNNILLPDIVENILHIYTTHNPVIYHKVI